VANPSVPIVRTLSEPESKDLVAAYGVPVPGEATAEDAPAAADAADALGYPVVVKLAGDAIAHKTERGLVRLGLATRSAVEAAALDLLGLARSEDGAVELLIAPMISGDRELIAGMFRDEQFGPLVAFGLGGVLAEAIGDVVFAPAPLNRADAAALIDRLATQEVLGAFRGQPAVDRELLVDLLCALGRLAAERSDVASVDLNPLIVCEGRPIAVDALVELADPSVGDRAVGGGDAVERRAPGSAGTHRLDPLFNPKGVVVAGASTHPGKFGFVTLHNLLAGGYEGPVFATNRERAEVLGRPTLASVDEVPEGEADLVVVCTPKASVREVLTQAAGRRVRAAFLTTAGYGEAGEAGRAEQAELVALAEELDLVIAGPNGQGVISTPAKLCAQIVAPNPPAGSIGVVSQSGNLVSAFLNHAVSSGVGVSRAISAGNAAMLEPIDYLEYFADDPATSVGLCYLEGVGDGRAFYERLRAVTRLMPVVVVKGGSTGAGARAAASHTGSLASDDRIVDGVLAQAGAVRAAGVEAGFDAAAMLATQPSPRGGRVVVVTTVGGWGVVAADAIERSAHLRLDPLPDDLSAAIDELLPPRWSRNNPIDLAGGETRDTVPSVLELVASHPSTDAVLLLGLGIQSNQAALMRSGGFYPDHGLERIVDYHERQDERYGRAAAEVSTITGKPVICATELAVTQPSNPAPASVAASGRYACASAERAVAALDAMVAASAALGRAGS
jgi:acetyl-CoA synthetase (ADP-forming)